MEPTLFVASLTSVLFSDSSSVENTLSTSAPSSRTRRQKKLVPALFYGVATSSTLLNICLSFDVFISVTGVSDLPGTQCLSTSILVPEQCTLCMINLSYTLMSNRYRPGPLLDLCLQYLKKPNRPEIRPEQLAPRSGFPERERLRLQRFIAGIRIITNQTDESGKLNKTPRVVKKVTSAGASDLSFQLREGGSMTVSVCVSVSWCERLRTCHRNISPKHTIGG